MDPQKKEQKIARPSGGLGSRVTASGIQARKIPRPPGKGLFQPKRPFEGSSVPERRLFRHRAEASKVKSDTASSKPWKKHEVPSSATSSPTVSGAKATATSNRRVKRVVNVPKAPTSQGTSVAGKTSASASAVRRQVRPPARRVSASASVPKKRVGKEPVPSGVAALRRPPAVSPEEELKRKKAQPYDWKHRAKFTNDQKKFLERIFKQFADYVTTKLAPLIQTRVSIEYLGAKLRTYSSFIQSLYEPITLVIMRLTPEYQGLIVVDFPLSFALIERCLGGKGEMLEEIRYFTEIETAVLERATLRLIEGYQEAWSEIKECKPQYVETQFNPQTVHIVKPSDMMVCVTFDVRIAHAQGQIYVVLPFEHLKETIPKTNFEEFILTRSSHVQSAPTVAPLFAKNLEMAKVPVSVELGSTELLFQELAVLEVGDFIKLDQDITRPLKIKVNDRVKFLGRPGIRDNKLAVQITKVLQEGDEEFEE